MTIATPATSPAVSVDELLAERDWLQRLAVRLTGRDDEADDLAQDAIETALREPPASGRPLRGWLATVLRNRRRAQYRSTERRQRREAAAAPAGGRSDDAETAVARVQLQRVLAGAVLELDEPYRTAVVLRFFSDLTPAEIANAQGIPAATVRSHVKRGVDRLRAALERTYAAEHRDWRLALAPLLPAPSAPASAAGASTAKVALVAAAAVAVAGGVAFVTSDGGETTRSPVVAGSPASAPAPALATERTPAPANAAAPPSAEPRRATRFDSPTARQTFAAAVARARRARIQRHPGPATATAAAPEIEADYIRASVRELTPLLKECHALALDRVPDLAGTLAIELVLASEPDVGGFVETVDFGEGSSIDEPGFRECARESMYALELPAAGYGGRTALRYVYAFRPPDGSGGGTLRIVSGATSPAPAM